MHSDSILSGRTALVAVAVFAVLLGTASTADAQSTPNDLRILRHIQPRAHQTLNNLRMSKAASEDTVLLDQRWMYEWNVDRWGQIAQTVYVYNKTDRTEEWQFVWNGFAFVSQSRTTYAWENGRAASELYEQWDPNAGDFYETDRYLYGYMYDLFTGDVIGVETIVETRIGDEWRPLERSWMVKETETLTTGSTDEWAGETWSSRSRFRLEQTDQSVVQTEEEWGFGAWLPTTRTTFYGYTIDGLRAATEEYLATFLEYAGLLYGAHLFPNYTVEKWNGASWIPTERKLELVTNPDVGNGLWFRGSIYEVFDGDQFVAEHRIYTTYPMSDDKPIRADLSHWTGNEFALTLEEMYEHDGLGDMTRATQQVDFGEGLENSLQFAFVWSHVSVGVEDGEIPGGFALDAAYPNPFNPATTLQYRLATGGAVAVRAYDALGRPVATLFEGNQTAGTHEVTFDASGLSSGLYMIRLEAPGFSQVRAVTLLK